MVSHYSPSALPPLCKFKVKRTILTKIKYIIYTPTSKDGDPYMDGTTYNSIAPLTWKNIESHHQKTCVGK